MYRMAPIDSKQIGMMLSYLKATEREPQAGFKVRDVVMHNRIKGRGIAKGLPGIGADFKWLERRTDDYDL